MAIGICYYLNFVPRIKPYVDDIIDNEYVLDIILGVGIFIVVIFLILMINKGISKAVKYSGLRKTRYCFWILFWIFKRIYYLRLYFFNC